MGFLRTILGKREKGAAVPLFCSVVVVAGGRATRMEGVDKVMAPLAGRPLILHGLLPFQESDLVDEIVLVAREDLMVPLGHLCSQNGITKVTRVVKGGDSRAQSVLAGLKAVSPDAVYVAIHDGARPFVTKAVLEKAILAARQCSAAAPAIPVKDTIKRAEDQVVTETPDRATLFAVQTPQVFEKSLITAAVTQAVQEEAPITDDCSAVERLGFPVHLTQGSEENIKITTPLDLLYGEAILAARRETL